LRRREGRVRKAAYRCDDECSCMTHTP
jgi:hypothetical protein